LEWVWHKRLASFRQFVISHERGILSFFLLSLSQPDTGTTAILVDELHARDFESPPYDI
jgi:hypothetical protein